MIADKDLPVGVDVDEVVADLLGGCCEFVNTMLHEHRPLGSIVKIFGVTIPDPNRYLLPEDLRGWEVSAHFGAGWQQWLTAPDFYKKYVRPMSGARLGIQRLRDAGERVVFVTSCVFGSTNQKQQWLVDWGFLDQSNVENDFMAMKDKKLVRLKALFDDGVHNVEPFPGPAFLVNHWHNSETPCTRPRIRGIYEALDTLRAHGLAKKQA